MRSTSFFLNPLESHHRQLHVMYFYNNRDKGVIHRAFWVEVNLVCKVDKNYNIEFDNFRNSVDLGLEIVILDNNAGNVLRRIYPVKEKFISDNIYSSEPEQVLYDFIVASKGELDRLDSIAKRYSKDTTDLVIKIEKCMERVVEIDAIQLSEPKK